MRLPAALLSLAVTSAALAAPTSLPHSGLLLASDDRPLDGSVSMVFRIYDRATTSGEVLIWTSDPCPVAVRAGYYAITLGAECGGAAPLDTTHLPPGAPRYLDVQVESVRLVPRLALATLPNAAVAATALELGGLARAGFWEESEDLVGAKFGASTLGAAIGGLAAKTGGNTFTGDQIISGNLGLGTTPGVRLDVNGTARATSFLGDGAGLTNVTASALGSALEASLDARYPVLTSGRIAASALPTIAVTRDGSGTVTLGSVVLGSTGISCGAAGSEGAIRYESVSKTLQFCDGSNWRVSTANVASPLPGWVRRRAFSLTTASTVTDTQHRVVLDTQSLVSLGRMRSDCADIRLTSADGTTHRPFFVERCNTTATSVWFRVASLPAGTTGFYVYYDNALASLAANGSTTFASEITGVVGAWTFDEGTGTFQDQAASGTTWTTTLAGAGYTGSGKQGAALSVLNHSTMVSPSPTYSPGTAFTVTAWGNPSQWDTNHNTLVGQGNGFLLAVGSTGAVANWIYAGGSWQNDGSASATLSLNTWTHLALTYNGATIRSYVNGVANGAGTAKTGAMGTLTNVGIGYRPVEGGPQLWKGLLDEVRIFNRVLTTTELSDVATKCSVVSPAAAGRHFVRTCSPLDGTSSLAAEERF